MLTDFKTGMFNEITDLAPRKVPQFGNCDHGHLEDSLYPTSVYQCRHCVSEGKPSYFRTYASGGAVCWCCHTCGKAANYVGWTCTRCNQFVVPDSHKLDDGRSEAQSLANETQTTVEVYHPEGYVWDARMAD